MRVLGLWLVLDQELKGRREGGGGLVSLCFPFGSFSLETFVSFGVFCEGWFMRWW